MLDRKRIVLLHGWGASTNKLDPLGKELHRLGWKVSIPKLPGFDISPPKKPWGIGEYAEYVIKETQKIWERKGFFIFGHSFGGRIAIKLAGINNKQFLGIILCSASGLSRGNLLKRVAFWVLAKAGKILSIVPPIAKIWRKLLYKVAREHDYEKTQGVMKETFKKVISENVRPIIENIEIPTLILWGRQDRMTPISDAYCLKQILPGSKLIIFNNEGHQLPYHKPRKMAEKIDQWTKSLT